MGFSGISLSQLLILLVVIILVFGTKKLRNVGGDIGAAIKSFRKALHEDEKLADKEPTDTPPTIATDKTPAADEAQKKPQDNDKANP